MTREFPAHLYLKPAKADQIARGAPAIPTVDGATCYASAEIDTMKPTRIASLLAQTVTG